MNYIKLQINIKKVHIALLFIAFINTMQAQPVKRIYLGNDDHTDFMWTANEVTIMQHLLKCSMITKTKWGRKFQLSF